MPSAHADAHAHAHASRPRLCLRLCLCLCLRPHPTKPYAEAYERAYAGAKAQAEAKAQAGSRARPRSLPVCVCVSLLSFPTLSLPISLPSACCVLITACCRTASYHLSSPLFLLFALPIIAAASAKPDPIVPPHAWASLLPTLLFQLVIIISYSCLYLCAYACAYACACACAWCLCLCLWLCLCLCLYLCLYRSLCYALCLCVRACVLVRAYARVGGLCFLLPNAYACTRATTVHHTPYITSHRLMATHPSALFGPACQLGSFRHLQLFAGEHVQRVGYI